MNKINLDHIRVPGRLSSVVDSSIRKAAGREKLNTAFRRFVSAAAMLAMCIVALNFNDAVAFAGAAKQFFTALYNNTFDNRSRIEAINNGYFSDDVPVGISESGNLRISLVNYYIDCYEAGFEYIVTGRNLDEYSDMVRTSNRKIIITDNTSGEAQIWKETFNPETSVSERIFPGGRFFSDPKNGIHEYERGGNELLGDTRIAKIGEDTYSMVDTIRFSKPIAVGDEITLQYSSFAFTKKGGALTEEPSLEYVEGSWIFNIVVDDKFKNANIFLYEIVNGDTQKGVRLEGVSTTPLVTKLTFAVDYSKNEIADPNNINTVSEPQYVYKLNLMDLCGATVIQAGDNVYENKAGAFIESENGIDRCVLEFDTLYFRDTESFSVIITERNGEVIKFKY